ncbi:MAG: hypothetical protein H0X16_12695 [Chloroflexi bacterium]|nr:hypothetical protein [Chloroflexota bacterium]HEV8054842.1 hypothetical protein [Candidatus Limnocylindrales bacterium]
MGSFYPWIVFLHVAASFGFFMGHGVSMFASEQIRRERDPARIRAFLDLSRSSLVVVYVSLVVLLLAGIAAGLIGGHFARLWVWLSLGILAVVIVAMYAWRRATTAGSDGPWDSRRTSTPRGRRRRNRPRPRSSTGC